MQVNPDASGTAHGTGAVAAHGYAQLVVVHSEYLYETWPYPFYMFITGSAPTLSQHTAYIPADQALLLQVAFGAVYRAFKG